MGWLGSAGDISAITTSIWCIMAACMWLCAGYATLVLFASTSNEDDCKGLTDGEAFRCACLLFFPIVLVVTIIRNMANHATDFGISIRRK